MYHLVLLRFANRTRSSLNEVTSPVFVFRNWKIGI